uniref:CSON006730 protein n=1 Tax=Culicoides sonorensis TaxID=179676 RepID=A0A336MX37_CULSO
MIHIDETDPVGDVEPAFPYRDVKIKRGVDPKESYELIEEIGRGKFGTVFKVKEKSNGFLLAAKFIPIQKRGDRGAVTLEIDMMNRLQHPKIIQLYDAYEYNKSMCVVLELVNGGELFDRVLDENFVMTDKVCAIFVRQICEAMQYIHSKNIIHLDLKPENILCTTREGNRIKIIDFGLAREYDPDKKLQVLFGTPEFVAPEVVNFESISFATDMWSVGVIAYVLVSGLSPFAGETDVETMANVTIGKYDFLDEAFDTVSPEAIDFITKLLEKDKNVRMTAEEALKHKWVKKKPQYYPSKAKTNTEQFQFKPVRIDLTPSPDPQKENLKHSRDRWNENASPYMFNSSNRAITPVNEKGSPVSSSVLSSSKGENDLDQTTSINGTSISVCDNNNEKISKENESVNVSESPVTNKTTTRTNPSDVSETIKEIIGDLHEKVTKLEEIVKQESVEKHETKPRVVEIRREIKPLPLPPNFIQRALTEMDESIDHMFVRGVPRTRSSNNRTFSRIVTRFNSTETGSQSTETFSSSSSSRVEEISEKSTSDHEKSKRSMKFSSLKSSLFGKSFDNDDGDSEVTLRHHGTPWSSLASSSSTVKRMKFRISSLSRDVPPEAPDLHTGFIMDEAIKLASQNGMGSKGKSLLQFLENCVIKNQN